ncbi:putative GTP-binding protein 6 isoform 2-T3 [Spinachia spinachia]
MLYNRSAVAALRRIHAWFPVPRPRRAHTCLTSSATCRPLRRPAPALAATCPPRPREFSLSACRWRNTDDDDDDDDEDGEDDVIDDSEVEELFQLRAAAGGLGAAHRVFVVHPDVKWGSQKQHLTTAELMMAEAVGLVNTLDGWSVVDKVVMSTKTPEKKLIFGKGNFQTLTDRIRRTAGITAVFVNVERLSALSEREFEEAWGVKVFDRYSVVLHIFRCNARTKEAKLQISLAEIPLLRSRLKNEMADLDQQGGGSRYIGGSGETLTEVQQRLLRERELKIRSALEKLRRKRRLLRSQRRDKELPAVSVLGYTNCGEATDVNRVIYIYIHGNQFLLDDKLCSASRKDDADQGADGRRRPPAQKPAVRHAGRHRARRPAQSHDRPVRGHHRLPVPAATPAHRLLLRHAGGHQTLGCPRPRQGRQPPGDGQPEGQRAASPGEHADPRPAAELHDRGPQ